jgi:hypothetical protein
MLQKIRASETEVAAGAHSKLFSFGALPAITK